MTTAADTTIDWPRWEDPEFYLQDPEVIQEAMAAQRRAAPVHWYEAPGLATGFWVISKWEDARFVGSHPELFSNRFGFGIGDASEVEKVQAQLPQWAQSELRKPGLTPAERRGLIARGKLTLGDPGLENMMLLDPPRHGQVRGIFMGALKPSLVRSLRPKIAEIADEILDTIEPGAEIDFVTTVGRIPATLMTELIGVPRDFREEFIEMAKAHLGAITITPDKDQEEVERLQRLEAQLHTFCDELLAERQANPSAGDDLVSVVARSQLDGAPVPRALAFVFITHFLIAGEATRDVISHLAMALAERPEQRRLMVERPELIPNAVNEAMRYYTPVWSGARTALDEVEIRGRTIKKGDFVVMAYASANRDEDVFENPDDFDITRPFEHDHLGFGYGEHSCPGALLARIDAAVIWERVLARFSDWELTGPPQTWRTPFLRGVSSLPIKFDS
jgi:cytochrome P450